MAPKQGQVDQKILADLKKPIDDLIEAYYSEKNPYQRLRLRQLAWQAVDILAKTEDVANLKSQKDIQRIIRDIRQVGASEEFIEDSLGLAASIYRKLQTEYPSLLRRYQGKGKA